MPNKWVKSARSARPTLASCVRAWREAAAFGGTSILRTAVVIFGATFLGAIAWGSYEWLRYVLAAQRGL
jgi:hypothetical protein